MQVTIDGGHPSCTVVHAILGRDASGIPSVSVNDVKSRKFRAAVQLPDGSQLSIRNGRSTAKSPPAELWALAETARIARPGLEFWGRQAPDRAAPPLTLALQAIDHTRVSERPGGHATLAVQHKWLSGTLRVLQISIPGAGGMAPRLVWHDERGPPHVLTLIPMLSADRSLRFEVVPARGPGGRVSFAIAYPPSITASFWHFAARRLHDGARTLGRHLLETAEADQHVSPECALYAAGAYCLQYGMPEDIRHFLARASVESGTSPVLTAAVARTALMLRTTSGQRLTAGEAEILLDALSGQHSLSAIELCHTRAALLRNRANAHGDADVIASLADRTVNTQFDGGGAAVTVLDPAAAASELLSRIVVKPRSVGLIDDTSLDRPAVGGALPLSSIPAINTGTPEKIEVE